MEISEFPCPTVNVTDQSKHNPTYKTEISGNANIQSEQQQDLKPSSSHGQNPLDQPANNKVDIHNVMYHIRAQTGGKYNNEI